jgi:hypothetical protein
MRSALIVSRRACPSKEITPTLTNYHSDMDGEDHHMEEGEYNSIAPLLDLSRQNILSTSLSRIYLYVEKTTHIGAVSITFWHSLLRASYAVKRLFCDACVACSAILWRNRYILPGLAIVLIVGILLVYQGSQGELDIFLMICFSWAMILLAIISRIGGHRIPHSSV